MKTTMTSQVSISKMFKLIDIPISQTSQNISAKESRLQAFLQTEAKSDVRLWYHDNFEMTHIELLRWPKGCPRDRNSRHPRG